MIIDVDVDVGDVVDDSAGYLRRAAAGAGRRPRGVGIGTCELSSAAARGDAWPAGEQGLGALQRNQGPRIVAGLARVVVPCLLGFGPHHADLVLNLRRAGANGGV